MKRIVIFILCFMSNANISAINDQILDELSRLQEEVMFIPECQQLVDSIDHIKQSVVNDQMINAARMIHLLLDYLKIQINLKYKQEVQALERAQFLRRVIYEEVIKSLPKYSMVKKTGKKKTTDFPIYSMPRPARKRLSSPLREIHTNIID